jgi:DNA polymerase-1
MKVVPLMSQPPALPNRLVLIDGSGFIFRAFHALPPLTRPTDGTPVGAVYGFSNILSKTLESWPGSDVLVVFDAGRESFRTKLYAEYKANRPPPPEELVPQFPLCREAVTAFGVPQVELAGYEADDLIASYAKTAQSLGQEVVIISSDKDLMQLIKPGIAMFDPMKNKDIGPEQVLEKFGVTPDKVGDVLALSGDSSDNVPGAPGIGVKTAAQLLADFGSLENLLAQAHTIKQPKKRETLITYAEQIRLSRQLVALDDNAPLPIAIADLTPPKPEASTLAGWLNAQGFKSLAVRLGARVVTQSLPTAAVKSPQDAAPKSNLPFGPYETVSTAADLKNWIDAAMATGYVAVDTETTSLTPAAAELVGISLCSQAGKACYIPLAHCEGDGLLVQKTAGQMEAREALALLKPLLEDDSVLKIGQNLKYDWQIFAKHHIHLTPWDDTMLLSYVLDSGVHGHGMDELSELFLGHKPIAYDEVCGKGKSQISFAQVPLDKATAYAAEDADVTLRLWQLLKPRLVTEAQTTLYETIERPMVGVVAQMEQHGVLVNPEVLRKLSQTFAEKMAVLEKKAHQLAGREFNIGSPKQLGEILFDEMSLQGGSKGKAGAWSTDADVLEDLALQGHEIADVVLEWRSYQKLRSTYAETLPLQINPRTGRIHTAFSLAGAVTGRLSSSDPNLQNIPIRTEDGRAIRKAFIAPEGHVLMSVDYSQIELRLLAHVAQIPALKSAFIDGVDIHAKTASEVFGVPLSEMTPEVRRRAKAINFGIIYGISAFGLARQLAISQGEAAAYIKLYFERFPELKAYMDSKKDEARQHGFVSTLYGRKCHLPSITDKNPARRNYAERQAINAPLQGTAADIIKRAMIAVPPALQQAGLKARMILQVHDELLFEVPEAEVEATRTLVKSIMENAASLSVPLVCEAGVGANWDDAH